MTAKKTNKTNTQTQTLLSEFNVKKREKEETIDVKDYDVFPDKAKLDALRTKIVQSLINNEIPDNISLEQAIEIVKISIPILDETVSESDFQETIDDLENGKKLNGYYCGKVGILWIGDDLMLKYE